MERIIIDFADKIIPTDLTQKGLLYITVSLVMGFMSFFVGDVVAVVIIALAALSSLHGQWLIFSPANKKQRENGY